MVQPRGEAPLDKAVGLAVERLAALGIAEQSVRAMTQTWARFRRFAEYDGRVRDVGSVDADLTAAFVRARHGDGQVPSVAAMHWRRSALRLLFRIWRELGHTDGDPTLDLVLPPRSRLEMRSVHR